MEKIKNNILNVKRVNVDIVRNAIREAKYGTKQEISSITGLSISTCGVILNDLVKTEEVLTGLTAWRVRPDSYCQRTRFHAQDYTSRRCG